MPSASTGLTLSETIFNWKPGFFGHAILGGCMPFISPTSVEPSKTSHGPAKSMATLCSPTTTATNAGPFLGRGKRGTVSEAAAIDRGRSPATPEPAAAAIQSQSRRFNIRFHTFSASRRFEGREHAAIGTHFLAD